MKEGEKEGGRERGTPESRVMTEQALDLGLVCADPFKIFF